MKKTFSNANSIEESPYELKLIDLEKYYNHNTGFYEIDFYQDVNFDSEIHVLLYKKESWGNIQYYKLFQDMKKKNIKIIVYSSFVLFPIASKIAHKCILQKTDIAKCVYESKISRFGFDRGKAWNIYNIKALGGWYSQNANTDLKLPNKNEINFNLFFNKTYVDTNAYVSFINNKDMFEKDKICVEIKHRPFYKKFINHFKSKKNNNHFIGFDKQYQKYIFSKIDSNYYLSIQIFQSVFLKMKYIGIAGAGSLLSMVPAINTIFLADENHNVSDLAIECKSYMNKKIYGLPTYGTNYTRNELQKINYYTYFDSLMEKIYKSCNSIQEPQIIIN